MWGIWKLFVLFSQFFCKYKRIQKLKVTSEKENGRNSFIYLNKYLLNKYLCHKAQHKNLQVNGSHLH